MSSSLRPGLEVAARVLLIASEEEMGHRGTPDPNNPGGIFCTRKMQCAKCRLVIESCGLSQWAKEL